MTLQEFIKENGIIGTIKQKAPNKAMKKYISQFKYIDACKLWYDDTDNPKLNTWIDVEGVGYGWLWLNHQKSKKLQRKSIVKFAMGLYMYSKNEVCVRIENDVVDIFLESKDSQCIFQIRVSNNELDWL